MTERAPDRWRKSSRSGAQSDCVDVRCDLGAVRDSKVTSAVLAADLRALVDAVKAGQFG